jgi:hypothetical protein
MIAMSTPKTLPKPILKQNRDKSKVKIFKFSDSDDSEQSSNELSIKLEKLSINEEERQKRKNSANYVLHNNHKIAKDLVEVISESTDRFLKHLEIELNGIYNIKSSKTSKTRHKETFLKKLEEFLTGSTVNSDYVISEINQRNKDIINFMCKNELTLSNPDIALKYQNFSMSKIPFKKHSPISKILKEEKGMVVSSSLPGCSFLINKVNQRANYSFFNSINNESIASSKSKLSFFDSQKGNFETDELIEANKTTKKIVRFADSLGLDLENVRVISSFSNNNSFLDAFDYYRNKSSPRINEDSFYIEPKAKVKTLILIPNFCLAPNMDTESYCKLADFLFDNENKILKLLIRVRNISYEKRVFVRFTFNNWKNSNDIEAIFTKITNLKTFTSSSTGTEITGSTHDYFIVTIFVPDCEQNHTYNIFETNSNYFYIEFAVFYKTNSDTHWDNNFGKNYSFQCINQLL